MLQRCVGKSVARSIAAVKIGSEKFIAQSSSASVGEVYMRWSRLFISHALFARADAANALDVRTVRPCW